MMSLERMCHQVHSMDARSLDLPRAFGGHILICSACYALEKQGRGIQKVNIAILDCMCNSSISWWVSPDFDETQVHSPQTAGQIPRPFSSLFIISSPIPCPICIVEDSSSADPLCDEQRTAKSRERRKKKKKEKRAFPGTPPSGILYLKLGRAGQGRKKAIPPSLCS